MYLSVSTASYDLTLPLHFYLNLQNHRSTLCSQIIELWLYWKFNPPCRYLETWLKIQSDLNVNAEASCNVEFTSVKHWGKIVQLQTNGKPKLTGAEVISLWSLLSSHIFSNVRSILESTIQFSKRPKIKSLESPKGRPHRQRQEKNYWIIHLAAKSSFLPTNISMASCKKILKIH